MKKLMRYRITAGRAVEVRDVLMETRGGTPRGARRGKSSAKQLKRNEDEAVLILARQLNANCKGGDLFLTLKYSDSRLPATREEAKRIARNFMRRLARAYRKTTGKKLKRVHEDGAAGAPAPPRGHGCHGLGADRPALAAGGVFIPTPGCDRGLYRRGQVHDTQRRVRRSASLVPLSGYPAAPIFHAHPCGQSGHGAGAAGGPRG